MPSFGGEVKPSVPYRRFAACKRSLHLPWESHVVGKIGSAISRPYFLPSLIEVSHVAGRGAPLEMRGETRSGAQRAKGPFVRPRCIGAAEPRIRPLLYSTLYSTILYSTLSYWSKRTSHNTPYCVIISYSLFICLLAPGIFLITLLSF